MDLTSIIYSLEDYKDYGKIMIEFDTLFNNKSINKLEVNTNFIPDEIKFKKRNTIKIVNLKDDINSKNSLF